MLSKQLKNCEPLLRFQDTISGHNYPWEKPQIEYIFNFQDSIMEVISKFEKLVLYENYNTCQDLKIKHIKTEDFILDQNLLPNIRTN